MELSPNESEFLSKCSEARKVALSFREPLVVFHYDADGIAGGAIVQNAFRVSGRKYRAKWIKKLDDLAIEAFSGENELIFVDLGGGNRRVNELRGDVLIIDHHQTEGIERHQINPLLDGIDGGTELSSSGAAYCVFGNDVDVAITGAHGDMQHPLTGMNRWVLSEGVRLGEVKVENDLCFYGRFSRPLLQFLVYSDDPYVPGISYNEEGAKRLLADCGISELKGGDSGAGITGADGGSGRKNGVAGGTESRGDVGGCKENGGTNGTESGNLGGNDGIAGANFRGNAGGYRKYGELREDEKRKLISGLADALANMGMVGKAESLVGESCVFPKRPMGGETYEANEFSTLLNACGRHGKADIGVGVCMGDGAAALEARALLQYHRKAIRDGIGFAQANIQDFGRFLFLDARGRIDEGIIGIVCGMVIHPFSKKPMLGFSLGESNDIKVSSRGTRALIAKGLNLGIVMRDASAAVGGVGGGHRIAAGASIPRDKMNEFLLEVGAGVGKNTEMLDK